MADWTPKQIHNVTNEIENSIMDQIKKGKLTPVEIDDLRFAAQYGADDLDNAACALRDHLAFLRNKEDHTKQKG